MSRHEVYYNLHKKCLSARGTAKGPGRWVDHFESLVLHDVKFAVQPAGRDRVRATGRKNVHAFIRGTIEHFSVPGDLPVHGGRAERLINEIMTGRGMRKITYNPYKYDTFVVENTLTPVYAADKVYVVGRNIYAVGVK